MQKIKNVLGEFLRSKQLRATMMMALAMVVTCVGAMAADGETTIDTTAIASSFTSGFNSMVTNSISMISAMVPIALTLAGTLFLVRKAMSWFKAIGK